MKKKREKRKINRKALEYHIQCIIVQHNAIEIKLEPLTYTLYLYCTQSIVR